MKNPEFDEIEEFSDLLIEMSRELRRNNSLYFLNIAPSLEKITAYDYKNLDKDVAAGRIPEEELFMFKAMSLLRKRPEFDSYKTNLSDLVNYFKSPESNPDDALMDAYRKFLLDMAETVKLL